MSRKKQPSKTVTEAINSMYASMARAAARKAVVLAGETDGEFSNRKQVQAGKLAYHAGEWAERAGGNALRYGL